MNSERKQRLLKYAKMVLNVQSDAEVFGWINSHEKIKAEFEKRVDEAKASAPPASSAFERMESTEGIPNSVSNALEAIVDSYMRPVVDIVNDDFTAPDVPFGYLFTDAKLHGNICAGIPSVGRIGVPNLTQMPYGGTGFIVGEDLLMTNRHVAELVCTGLGQKGLSFRTGQSANIDFKKENRADDATNTLLFDVTDIVLIHPYWDMALFRTAGLGKIKPLTLSTAPVQDLQDADVVAIGYPAMDWRNDFQDQMRIYRGVFNVKRLQPGKIRGVVQVESFDKTVNALGHDATTLGGASGSALIDPRTGLAVGLHFGGVYHVGNYAVPLSVLAQDSRLAGFGIKFDGTVKTVVGPWDDYWAKADQGQEAVAPGGGSPSAGSPPPSPPAPPQAPIPTESNEWRMVVPLEITVRLGPQGAAPIPGAVPSPAGTRGFQGLASASPQAALMAVPAPMPVEIPTGKEGDPSLLNRRGFDLELAVFLAQASRAAYGNALETKAWAAAQGFDESQPIDRGNIQGFWCVKDDSTLLVFRGTSNPAQWLRDVQIVPVKHPWGTVHVGFRDGIVNVEPDLAIFDPRAAKAKNLWICGHSLGGALAVLAGARLKMKNVTASIYTYGQPLVGLADFVGTFNRQLPQQLFRLVNQSDIVARVPPLPFRHCQTPKWIVREGVMETISLPRIVDTEAPPCTPEEFQQVQQTLANASVIKTESPLEGVDIGSMIPFIHNHYIDEYIRQLTVLKSLPLKPPTPPPINPTS